MIYLGVIVAFFPAIVLTWYEQHPLFASGLHSSDDRLHTDTAIIIDLVCAGLQAGASLPSVVESIAQACGDSRLVLVGRALTLGVEWDEAWHNVLPDYQSLHQALRPAWIDGVDPLPLLEGASRSIRHHRDAHAKEAVEKLAVHLTLPLGLCQLPAFVLLGLVPLFLSGIARL